MSAAANSSLPEEGIIAAAAAAAERAEAPPELYTLSSGAVLRFKPVPPLAIREASLSVPLPAVPMVKLEDREELEPNPNDPDYLEAIAEREAKQFYVIGELLMMVGTEIASLPDNVEPIESDEWLEPFTLGLGMKIDVSNKYKRKLAWLRLYAIRTETEVTEVMFGITRITGTLELEVQRAAAAFRSRPLRRADSDSSVAEDGEVGD